jgi:hypothetical protein
VTPPPTAAVAVAAVRLALAWLATTELCVCWYERYHRIHRCIVIVLMIAAAAAAVAVAVAVAFPFAFAFVFLHTVWIRI